MMLLSTIKGRISAQVKAGTSANDVINSIARQLPDLGARQVETTERAACFRNVFLIGGPRLLYGGADKGEFSASINDGEVVVSYTISITTIFALITGVAITFLLIISLVGGIGYPVAFLFPIVFWLSFLGGNRILTRARSRTFIRRCLRNFSA